MPCALALFGVILREAAITVDSLVTVQNTVIKGLDKTRGGGREEWGVDERQKYCVEVRIKKIRNANRKQEATKFTENLHTTPH